MATKPPNFSQQPAAVLKAAQDQHYVGVHIEQGVPLLDRDVNLLGDLLGAALRSFLQRYIGNGVALGDDFAVQPGDAANELKIRAGSCLVNGVEIRSSTDLKQVAPLTTPQVARDDIVYLDVALDQVDEAVDPALANPDDVGMRTSLRDRVTFVVRVAEGAAAPPSPKDGHTHLKLAKISRPAKVDAIPAWAIQDLRPRVSVGSLIARLATLENVLLPSVTSLSATQLFQDGDDDLVITGRNFLRGSVLQIPNAKPVVKVDGVEWSLKSGSTDTELRLHVPDTARVGPGLLSVNNGIGEAFAPTAIKVDRAPVPVITDVQPRSAKVGERVTITGSSFGTKPVVEFTAGAHPVPAKVDEGNTGTKLVVVVPAGLPVGTAGNIQVTANGETGTTPQTIQFTVKA